MIIDRMKVLSLWRSAEILPGHDTIMDNQAKLALAYKAEHYDPVTASTGIPWYVVAALDMREEDFNHHGYLGNGDPINRITVDVPRGRGPFNSWYEGAIDALTLDHMSMLPHDGHWDIVTALIKCEGFNGMGYATKGLPSPYVWAGTTVQRPGKYTSDGHFSRTAIDHQPGCAGMFLALKKNHGIDLNEA